MRRDLVSLLLFVCIFPLIAVGSWRFCGCYSNRDQGVCVCAHTESIGSTLPHGHVRVCCWESSERRKGKEGRDKRKKRMDWLPSNCANSKFPLYLVVSKSNRQHQGHGRQLMTIYWKSASYICTSYVSHSQVFTPILFSLLFLLPRDLMQSAFYVYPKIASV